MAENKTQKTQESVEDFINTIDNEQKRADCQDIVKMMEVATKQPAAIWGTGIIGFGDYRYKSDSGRAGDWFQVGFAPRKANITLYLLGVVANQPGLMEQFGKHKTGGGCVYINKLADIDKKVLKSMIKESVTYVKALEKKQNAK